MVKKLQIRLLGEVSIQKNGKPIKGLPSRAAEALFLYLACNPKPIPRERLAELLWADRSTVQSLTNLRTILTALRRELGDHLIVTRDTLSFNTESDFSLDALEFENQMQEMGFPDHAALPADSATLEKLRLTLDLYRGDFLEGFYLRDGLGFEEWSLLQREHFRRLAQNGFRVFTLACLERGLYAEGQLAATRWSRFDPYNEEACRAQMWLLLRTGQRTTALQCYQNLKQKLSADLGVSPVSATTDLYRRFREIEVPAPIHLPTSPTEFIGRDEELTELESRLFAPESRLVTITGPGGMGKTRLAVQAARRIAETKPGRFLQGIHFIPLETLKNAEEMPIRVAEVIGFSFRGLEPPTSQLLEHLREQESLLLLDNFEHLLDPSGKGIGFLVEVLGHAPGVKLLVTSRERLNLYEEIVFNVHGLELPGDDVPAEKSDAMRLFVQCARRVRREFSLTGEDAGHVASICRMVEGAPLAIELASAWGRHHSCEQIASLISKDLDFLESPYANAPEKHRSLRVVFERSWSLLTAAEQIAFAQLSVFHGGFTLEAAQAVIGESRLVADLTDKSLIQRQPDERFYIHPLLQQYAAEKLAALSDALENAMTRHTGFYFDFLT
ncbi:MAG: AAA family ATPase, partial [Chloroflexi bacterium]|nr:AAA family ATPase [Chloroflexota bacterium]